MSFLYFRGELDHETYNYSLVEAGEQEIVRILQECLQRQSSADTTNKQLYHERTKYLTDKKVEDFLIRRKK